LFDEIRVNTAGGISVSPQNNYFEAADERRKEAGENPPSEFRVISIIF